MKKIFLLISIVAFLQAADFGILTKISDGDTFTFQSKLYGEYKCRVYGIDTPEKFDGKKLQKDALLAHVNTSDVQDVGKLATDYAYKKLHIGDTYKIFIDGKDIYGRYLCVVWLEHGNSYNEDAVRDGYAVVYKRGRYTKSFGMKEKLNNAQKDALYKNSGLWKKHYKIMRSMLDN